MAFQSSKNFIVYQIFRVNQRHNTHAINPQKYGPIYLYRKILCAAKLWLTDERTLYRTLRPATICSDPVLI